MKNSNNIKAKVLYDEFMKEYNHVGYDKKSFTRRLRNLEKRIDRNDETQIDAIMYVDVISVRIGIEL